MQPYPGMNGDTFVISTTPGAGGVSGGGVLTVVNDGAGHGTFPKNILTFAGDALQSGNLNSGPEGNKDAITWCTWRTIDWINGGDYTSLFAGTVQLGNTLIIRAGGNLTIGGVGGATFDIGDGTHAGNMFVTSTGTITLNSGALAASSASTTTGWNITGASGSNATAATFTGDGTGVGVKAVAGASQQAAVWAHNGCVYIDASLPTPTTDPGSLDNFWQNQIPRAFAQIVVNATGPTVTVGGKGFNVSSAAFTDPAGGHYTTVTVTLVRGMSSATDYVVLMPPARDGVGSGNLWCPIPIIVDATHFKFYVPTTYGGNTPTNIDTMSVTYMFCIFGS